MGNSKRTIAALSVLVGCTTACTSEWDDLTPEIPFTNSPVPLAPSQRINPEPVTVKVSVVTGADGDPWAAFCERWDDTSSASCLANYGGCRRLRLVRLAAPARDEVLEADGFIVHAKTVIAASFVDNHVRRILHRPGDPPARDERIDDAVIGLAPNEDILLSWIPTRDAHARGVALGVHRRDTPDASWSFIPISDKEIVAGDYFTRDGRRLVLILADPSRTARIVSYTVDDRTTRVLAELPQLLMPLDNVDCGEILPRLLVDEQSDQVIVPTVDGLRAVSLSTGAQRVILGPDGPIEPFGQRLIAGPDLLSLSESGASQGTLFRAPLDGHAPAERLRDGVSRLLGAGPHGEAIYSPTPYDTHTSHAAEGWLQIGGSGEDAWRIMEQGLVPTFSRDGARVRFLEHIATPWGVGELRSLALPLPAAPRDRTGDTSTIIARNAYCFEEAPDGRVLVTENSAFPGPWNRLVRIDETRRTKEWIAPGANCFAAIPGRNEVLVNVPHDPSGYDLYRVPLPD